VRHDARVRESKIFRDDAAQPSVQTWSKTFEVSYSEAPLFGRSQIWTLAEAVAIRKHPKVFDQVCTDGWRGIIAEDFTFANRASWRTRLHAMWCAMKTRARA